MKKLSIILLLFIPGFIFSNLKINEIMPKNVNYLLDDDYNFSMWVEVYNSGTYSLNQAAYFFTDDPLVPHKWQPTSHIIEAGAFQILYFERDDRYGHSNFKLDPQGGDLYIYDYNNNIIDHVTYPSQFRNSSWGRTSDGASEFAFFIEPSPGSSNNKKATALEQCAPPVFSIKGGLYTGSLNFEFVTPPPGDTIYYTYSSDEPSRTNSFKYIPGNKITVTTTRYIRAKTYSAQKLPSEVSTESFLINQRDFNLPVVSIVSPQKYLTDNTLGIYVRGTNGIAGNGTDSPANWNQDWDRPVNFELFDTANVCGLNQELDITIAGAWSRTINPQKSLFISPKKKFGNNKLKYDFFPKDKPGNKYKDIFLRNAGNDFFYSMMRDGFMNALVAHRLNLDYNAYEPAVCFINGNYYGIQNLRERSGKDYLYSNYKLDEDEFDLLDNLQMESGNAAFTELTNFVKNNDIKQSAVYSQFSQKIDIDNFIDYYISEIYTGNYDWPHNNIKIWRAKNNGKWRWLLYDLDFGFALYNTNLANVNSLTYAMGLTGEPEWSYILFKRLLENTEFKNKFIDRFCIHLNSTFKPTRVDYFIDSISSKIKTEISYHKAKWGSSRDFTSDTYLMKSFGAVRNTNLYNYLNKQFMGNGNMYSVSISSNQPNARYLMNNESIVDNSIEFNSFNNRVLKFEAVNIEGFDFKRWKRIQTVNGKIVTDSIESPTFTQVLTGNIQLMAVYELNTGTTITDVNEIKVLPIHITDHFTVQNGEGKTVEVFDLTGKSILNTTLSWMQEDINTSNWNTGIYIVRIGKETFKLIKLP